jgi:hypothetical protein
LIPVAVTITIMLLVGFIPKALMSEGFLRLVISTLATTASLFIVSYLFGLTHEEKQIVGKVTHKFVTLSVIGEITTNPYKVFFFITVPIAFLISIEIIKTIKDKEEDEEEVQEVYN